MTNLNVRYKIEVEGIDSFTQILPATISVDFTEGEVVIGTSSGATAVVDRDTSGTPNEIYIRSKSGFFFASEDLTSLGGGLAQKDGDIDILQAPYENTDFGISGGLWTLLSDGDLLTKLNDPVQKINISQGGNLASGYSFGFEVTNFEFAKALETDGVFFRNRKCTLYLGTVVGASTTWSKEWVGTVESFTDVSEETVSFNCTDLTKMNTETVGSDLLPIALNRNYNCKLVLNGEKTDNFNYIPMSFGDKTSFISKVTSDENGVSIEIPSSDQINRLINTSEFTNVLITVVIGGGQGNVYNVVKAVSTTFTAILYLDTENADDLKVFDGGFGSGFSLITLKKFNFIFNLSNKSVKNLHTTSALTDKQLNITDSDIIYLPSIEVYENIDNKQIKLNNVVSEKNILVNESENTLDTLITGESSASETQGSSASFSLNYTAQDTNKFVEISNKYTDLYYRPVSIKINNGIINESDPSFDPLDFTTSDIIEYFDLTSINYKKTIGSKSIRNNDPDTKVWYDGGDRTLETNVTVGTEADHYNLEITFPNWQSFKSLFTINGIPSDTDIIDLIEARVRWIFKRLPSTSGGISQPNLIRWDSTYFNNIDNWDVNLSVDGFKEISVDKLSIGCNGENVFGETYYVATVPQTIDYLLTNYYDKTASDIDSASFDQANTDFGLFVNDPVRNPAHQITEQTDGNQLLKDILYAHHLGMYINRAGEYALENWLPKSIIFSTTTTLADFDDTNTIDIKPIKRDSLNGVISDYQQEIDLSEATGDYNRTLRVKNTNESVFNFARDIEGVDASDEGLAFSAWQLLKAGFSRINKLSQTQKQSKWHKLSNSNGTGTSEAIAFIRNQSAHINREHEVITFTVPYNSTNLSLELLSFISIEDQKITDNVARKGWIVERKLNLKNDTITWKLLLDINPFDPFLYRVNVWKDGAFVANVKTDGNYPDNIKANGTGT